MLALKESHVISESAYDLLRPCGSRPGVLYGLPKVHKENTPMRPILSALSTHNYSIAKFLVPVLQPITTNNYSLKDSFEFVSTLESMKHLDTCVMASFDIKSLFTQIPIQETIDIATFSLFPTADTSVHGLNAKQFRSLLELAVQDCHFQFDNQLYDQIDGVAMGSPLGPSMANAFLCFHENHWLENCPRKFKPILYKRYVDDCFLIFKKKDDVLLFLDYLNSKHSNIEFTHELEKDGTLPFLDVQVKFDSGSFTTSVFRKKTFTVCEHLGRSVHTGKVLNCPQFSAVRNHCNTENHAFSSSDFSILAQVSHRYDLDIAESLLIAKNRPSLNTQEQFTTNLLLL